MTIDWLTIIVSVFSSLLGGVVVLAGVFVAWGRLQEQVKNHSNCLDSGKKRMEEYDKIKNHVEAIDGRCTEREKMMAKNDKDHIEIFGRLHSLEIGMAALPGQMAKMIDERFEKLRENFRSDLKSVIYETKNEK